MTRILLVQPGDAAASAFTSSLGHHSGWEVTRVSSVLDAIRTAGESRFDAAVVDYDLPDGTGLDLLDFLRIGSPGIRIVLLADPASEEVTLHALSHGAADVLVKNGHLEMELARRVEGLLDHVEPALALVETLRPGTYEPAVVERPREAEPSSALEACLREIVSGGVIGVGVFDPRGRPVGVRLLPDLDAEGLGFALATIHGQMGGVWTYANLKPEGYTQLIDIEGGLLGVTAIPGTFLVGVLFEGPMNHHRALEKLENAAHRLTQALQA